MFREWLFGGLLSKGFITFKNKLTSLTGAWNPKARGSPAWRYVSEEGSGEELAEGDERMG